MAKSDARGGKPTKNTMKPPSEIGSRIGRSTAKRPLTGIARSSYRFRVVKITRRDTEYEDLK